MARGWLPTRPFLLSFLLVLGFCLGLLSLRPGQPVVSLAAESVT